MSSRTWWAAGGLTVGGLVLAWWLGHAPPQIGPDLDVMRSVDALFTAVTARDPDRLTVCERRLQTHADAGRLPSAAHRSLASIVATARGGDWEPAARTLYAFIAAQRREGDTEVRPKKRR